MYSNNFSITKSWHLRGLAILRILTGLLMAYHGLEIFDQDKMAEYAKWEVLQTLPSPLLMIYVGKGIELVSGVLLTIGLLTRTAALVMAINMFVICFKVGGGKFYYEDQHPFLFGLLALVFFFTGPVCWSLDQIIFKKHSHGPTE